MSVNRYARSAKGQTSALTVFGTQGFIRSALAARLRADGHEVYTPTRGDRSIFAPWIRSFIGLTADFRRYPFGSVEVHILPLAKYQASGYAGASEVWVFRGKTILICPSGPSTGSGLVWLYQDPCQGGGLRDGRRGAGMRQYNGYTGISKSCFWERLR